MTNLLIVFYNKNPISVNPCKQKEEKKKKRVKEKEKKKKAVLLRIVSHLNQFLSIAKSFTHR